VRIRITDLREPELTEAQRDAIAAGEQTPVELSEAAVLGAAVDHTGLDDFGPDDFRPRLRLWLDEADHDPQRNGLGRHGIFAICARYAANRLRIHDLLTRHPEIHDVAIRAPIVVVGLPRSGTTHLVNLIAADSRLRSLPLWESYEPVPDPRETHGAGGVDPRITRADQRWEAMRATLPHMAAMHPMQPEHIHEELELQVPDFSSYSLEWHMRCPRWRDYYLAHDQTPHYAYLKSVLQILQWYRPRDRWVLKCPQHLEQLGPLLATFPDATVVMTHRDPVSVVQSAATMLTYIARLSYTSTDPDFYMQYWTARIQQLLTASVRDRHLLPPDRTVDVLFHEFMADEMGTVARIYDAAGLPLTATARGEIEHYVAAHPRGKDGQVVYDLRGDFGVAPDDVRAHFGFYHDRFPIRIEVT
jgi:hypothetical protein